MSTSPATRDTQRNLAASFPHSVSEIYPIQLQIIVQVGSYHRSDLVGAPVNLDLVVETLDEETHYFISRDNEKGFDKLISIGIGSAHRESTGSISFNGFEPAFDAIEDQRSFANYLWSLDRSWS